MALEAEFIPSYIDGLRSTICDLRASNECLHQIVIAALRQYGDIHLSDFQRHMREDVRFEQLKDEANRRTVIRLEQP